MTTMTMKRMGKAMDLSMDLLDEIETVFGDRYETVVEKALETIQNGGKIWCDNWAQIWARFNKSGFYVEEMKEAGAECGFFQEKLAYILEDLLFESMDYLD